MSADAVARIAGIVLAALRFLATTIADHPVAVVSLGALINGVVIGWLLVRRRIRARWREDSRVVTVLPPAKLTGTGAVAGAHRFWRDLMGTTPPRWRRLLLGHPHIAMEFWLLASTDSDTEAGTEFSVRLWIPGPIAPGRVENAVRAAWPGSLILQLNSDGGTGSSPLNSCATATGGVVRPERGEQFPLHIPEARDDADPLRALESLAGAMAPGECAVVQVLARPGVGRRLRRYRHSVRQLHTGHHSHSSIFTGLLTGVIREVLGILTPGPSTRHSAQSDHRYRATDPQRSEELRAIRDKAAHPQWEVGLRYAAGTTATGPAARDRVRGLADATFAVFAILSGRNALARHHLRHPATVVAGRWMRHGALLSVPELAAIAHLPARSPDLAGRRARAVPAPRHVTGGPLHRP